MNIASIYTAAGAEVEIIDADTSREVSHRLSTLTRLLPQLVHIAAPIRPSGTSVVFDFGTEKS